MIHYQKKNGEKNEPIVWTDGQMARMGLGSPVQDLEDSQMKPTTPLAFALHRAWETVGHFLFADQGADEVSGQQVREFMREYLDGETNPRARRFWIRLSDEEKRKALESAFPDETYRRNPS